MHSNCSFRATAGPSIGLDAPNIIYSVLILYRKCTSPGRRSWRRGPPTRFAEVQETLCLDLSTVALLRASFSAQSFLHRRCSHNRRNPSLARRRHLLPSQRLTLPLRMRRQSRPRCRACSWRARQNSRFRILEQRQNLFGRRRHRSNLPPQSQRARSMQKPGTRRLTGRSKITSRKAPKPG